MNKYFKYGEEETSYLIKRDPKLGTIVNEIGLIERPIILDPFECLVNSIVSQLISGKVAKTIYTRLENVVGEVQPSKIIAANEEDMRKCGMSLKKVLNIKDMANAIDDGSLPIYQFSSMDDKEIIKRLSALPGIGVWTAEMFLIFCLQRKDILSYDDLIIRRGVTNLYNHRKMNKKLFDKYRKRYSPYGSVAALYLWRWESTREKQ